MRFFLAILAAAVVAPQTAFACTPPAPPIRLNDESDTAYAERSQAFSRAFYSEERRSVQVALYDSASRVSLARVVASTELPGVLSDGISPGRRVEAQPVAIFKGAPAGDHRVVLQDTGMTTCGPVGGGSATAASPGDYILLFENVSVDFITGQFGIFLTEVGEPRVLQRFGEVVQQARAAAAR